MIVPLSKINLRQDEDGVWIAKSPSLPGCHAHGRIVAKQLCVFSKLRKIISKRCSKPDARFLKPS